MVLTNSGESGSIQSQVRESVKGKSATVKGNVTKSKIEFIACLDEMVNKKLGGHGWQGMGRHYKVEVSWVNCEMNGGERVTIV